MTRSQSIKTANEETRKLVMQLLRPKAPSGYSFKVPTDGVMYVSDGVDQQHERWYVVVQVQPESVMNTRAEEIQRILGQVEREMTQRAKRTVYLMSALPVI